MEILIPAAIILALLFSSAFFSGGELAMMALDEINIETEVRRGSRLAKTQRYLRSRPQRFLSTILISNNIFNIALATFAAGLAHKFLAPHLGEERALAVSAAVMTILITIFAELMPKTIAAISTAAVSRWVTYPFYVIDLLLTPVNWLMEPAVMPFIYLFTGSKHKTPQPLGREEVSTAIAIAYAGGKLHSTDFAVAREALRFSQRNLADVMTPRVDVVAVPAECHVGDALLTMINTGFSRIPVYRDNLDEVIGVLFLKDLVRAKLRHQASDAPDSREIDASEVTQYMREVTVFPATKSIVEALAEIRKQRLHLAVVVDEHGGTAGIVALEDILEELVGDIRDETDHPYSTDVVRRTAESTIVTGRTRLEQLPELECLDLGETSASTVGGLMMERLGRPAVVGDQLEVDGVRITALKVLHTSIKLLRIEQLQTAEDAP